MRGNLRLPSLSYNSFSLGFQEVLGAIDPIGVLMGMVSSILSLSIIRSRVHLLLASYGRGFGKSRFLRGWLSSCGPQPMVGFLPWII